MGRMRSGGRSEGIEQCRSSPHSEGDPGARPQTGEGFC